MSQLGQLVEKLVDASNDWQDRVADVQDHKRMGGRPGIDHRRTIDPGPAGRPDVDRM